MTANFVYVSYSEPSSGRTYTARLNRDEFESEAGAWSMRWGKRFYYSKRLCLSKVGEAIRPPEMELLGIEELTLETLKAAYRQLSLEHHPDHGGDAAKFLAIKAAYEKLKPIAAQSEVI